MKTANKPITAEMAECLADIHSNGRVIRRHAGGSWRPGEQFAGRSYGTTTIEALVKRQRLVYSDWKETRNGHHINKFPIEATLAPEETP